LKVEVHYSEAAERDLRRVALGIAAYDPPAALRFVAGIREHCLPLATVPFMRRQRADIHPDIRSFPHGPRQDHGGIEILHIRHGRRQAPTAADLT
jgi:plasmid stabilization system protein ParE